MRTRELVGLTLALSLGLSVAAAGAEPRPARDLDAMVFDGSLTRTALTGQWGDGYTCTPDLNTLCFQVSASGEWPYRRIWLSFDPAPPHHLTRALLLTGEIGPRTTELFNDLQITRNRSWSQLAGNCDLHIDDVAAAWGPPDSQVGSGIERWIYNLSNGTSVAIYDVGGLVLWERPQGCPPLDLTVMK